MAYFAKETIAESWKKLSSLKVPNKFFGLLSIFKILKIDTESKVKGGQQYQFISKDLSNFLNQIFYFGDDIGKSYHSEETNWIMMSTDWEQVVVSDHFDKKPDILDVVIVMMHRVNHENPELTSIIEQFKNTFHLNDTSIDKLFTNKLIEGNKVVNFTNSEVKRSELKLAILRSKDAKNTIGFEGSLSIEANPGELSRAPFFQTLYATKDAGKLLLCNKFDFLKVYGFTDKSEIITTEALIPFQKIFYGPPGTGKSTKVNQLIEQYGFEAVRTTFHPDTDYQSFVGGYKPVVVKNEIDGKQEITYEYVPQAFTKVYVDALQNPEKRYLLIIEEINRGNCAQIFGDLFQCLDRSDIGKIHAEADLAKHLELKRLKSEIKLPSNLYIYATMNTSDQSLFPMDSAFKRRWDWEYVPIDYAKAQEFSITVSEEKRYNWGVFIAKVNKQIVEVTGSEDKQLGTFFVKPVAGVISLEVFKSKVLFYLWSEVFKNQLKTGDTIFHYDKEDGTAEEFTFAELFEPGRDMAILPSFMQKLGVDPLTNVTAV